MNRNQPLKVMCWNCNGISGKRHQLEILLNHHKPDIFALVETKLISSINDREVCDNYTLYRLDRPNSPGRGGGVLIGVLDSCNILVNNISPSSKGELLSVDLIVSGFPFTFVVYYHRPCVKNIDDFIYWYHNQSSFNHLIVGDFNLPDIDWSDRSLKKHQNTSMHSAFLNLLESSDLDQLITVPTHLQGNTLDLVLTNLETSIPQIEPSCSDHHLINFELFLEAPVTHAIDNNNTMPFWKFNKAKIPDIMVDCFDLESDIKKSIDDKIPIDQIWTLFKSTILKSAHNNIPSHTRKPKPSPWMTRSTKREIARRRRWHQTSKEHTSEENRMKVRQQSRLCDALVNRDYNSFINRHICDKLEGGDTKPLFKFISNRRGNSNTVKHLDGCSDDSAEAISDQFAKAFCSVFTVDDGSLPPTPKQTASQHAAITIEPKGVLKLLQSLDKTKGAGPDGLSPALLKFLSNYIYVSLAHIYQYSLNTGTVPSDWKLANVVPIHKKGSRTDPLNYRPISLTCIASKILEHIISHDINLFLDQHNLLSDCQHGFRKRHGCDTQLLSTVTDLIESFDNRVPVDIAVLDFSKAFDVVSHQKLMSKVQAMGIHVHTCNWLTSWLSNRFLSVIVNGAQSSKHAITSGVPQGSVLGPLLFLIFINDMPSCIDHCNLRLFADDSLIYHEISSQANIVELQSDLDRLAEWARTWQMSFNVSKCEHMRVTRKSDTARAPVYNFDNSSLLQVEDIKYLGIHIDCHLSFDKHIQEICRKATNSLHMLMRNLKKARTKTRTIAYKTICRPVLEYASSSRSPHKVKHVDTIEAINRKAFRWAHNKRKHDNISDLMRQHDWQLLAQRRQNADIKLYFRILSGTAAVDENKVQATHVTGHHTRTGPISGTVNSDTKRYSFKFRVYNYLNPSTHKFSDL